MLVDADGLAVTVDAAGKLKRAKRVASGMSSRRRKQRVEQKLQQSLDVSARPLEFPTATAADVASVETASAVVTKLKASRGQKKAAAAIAKLTPEPIDDRLPTAASAPATPASSN